VDVGVKHLAVTALPDHPHAGVAVDTEKYVRQLYTEFCQATHRLAVAPEFDETSISDLVSRYWPRFETAFVHAADEVIANAHKHDVEILVLEDLTEPKPLRACANCGLRLSTWCPPVVQQVIANRASAAGLSVTYVDPANSSQECHRCGRIGDLGGDTLRCINEDCPIDEVCRDKSAAATLAQRGVGTVSWRN
jgi:hypothetical protein